MGHMIYTAISDKVRRPLVFGMLILSTTALTQPAYGQIGGLISAKSVYENPDDHDLNLRYAKQEIRRGEMLNAASALERMLYAKPNWHSARLLYAAVLYRLDDPKAALRELSLLKGRDLNAYQEETYERYLTDFQTPIIKQTAQVLPSGQTSRTAYEAYDSIRADLTFGIRADDNAGNALTDEGFGFENRGDVSFNIIGNLRASKPISSDGTLTARAAIGGQLRRHETFSQANYDVIDLQAGLSKKSKGSGRISLDIDARRINIDGEQYLEQIGPRLNFGQDVSDNTRATVSLSAYAQDYDPLPNARLEDERDGVRTRLQLGFQTRPSPAKKITFAIGYDTKSADIGAFAYDGPQAIIGFEHKFESEKYLKTQIHIRQLNYKGSLDPTIDQREDTRLSIRQSLGMPLQKLVNKPAMKKVGLEFGINYNERDSNITANDFDNLGADLKLKLNF